MAPDLIRIVEVLKAGILRELGDEVDLIFRYGSFLKGTEHPYSDLDISYVPAHESTWKSITVMVDNVMCDLYPIHWSQLERMANFDDVSCTVLLKNEIVYQRSEAVAERFKALPGRLLALQSPEARPGMLSKAMKIFQGTGYAYYLLQQQVRKGHRLSCLQEARSILRSVLHCLAVCNQVCVDTRKLSQVQALPKLPVGFTETVEQLTHSCEPDELLEACERLLNSTRELLLSEQWEVHCGAASFPGVFRAGYPELKGDLQHLMLACERRDLFNFNLVSLYHELMIHLAEATTGVRYSDFNCLAEYEQDLTAWGFPDLLPYLVSGDLDGLRRQCEHFDQHLRQFLTERGVALNDFEDVAALKAFVDSGAF